MFHKRFVVMVLAVFLGLVHAAQAATLSRTYRLDFPDAPVISLALAEEGRADYRFSQDSTIPAFSEFAPFASAFGAQVSEIELSFTTYFFLSVSVVGDFGIPFDGGAAFQAISTVKVDGESYPGVGALAVDCSSGLGPCFDAAFNATQSVTQTIKIRDADDIARYVAGDVVLFQTVEASLFLPDGDSAFGLGLVRTFGQIRFDYDFPRASVAVAPVPLPASGGVFGLAVAGLVLLRRR